MRCQWAWLCLGLWAVETKASDSFFCVDCASRVVQDLVFPLFKSYPKVLSDECNSDALLRRMPRTNCTSQCLKQSVTLEHEGRSRQVTVRGCVDELYWKYSPLKNGCHYPLNFFTVKGSTVCYCDKTACNSAKARLPSVIMLLPILSLAIWDGLEL